MKAFSPSESEIRSVSHCHTRESLGVMGRDVFSIFKYLAN